MSEKLNPTITVIGIDIGKNSFHVWVSIDRARSLRHMACHHATLLIGMEACVAAHHLSRKLTSLGHDAQLMPAKYVHPYSRGQKNDFRDAEAVQPDDEVRRD